MKRIRVGFPLAALLIWTAPACAATITPTRLDDPMTGGGLCTPATDCSLRNAITSAGYGGTVKLRKPPSGKDVYTLTRGSPLTINSPVTIVGLDPRTTIVRQKVANQATFDLKTGQVGLQGITITGASGYEVRGVLDEDSDPVTLFDVSVTGNSSQGLFVPPAIPATGAGVANYGSGQLTISHSSVTANTAAPGPGSNGEGAAVFSNGGTVDVVDSTIAGNTAAGGSSPGLGGGIEVVGGTLNLSSVTLTDNTTTGIGATGGNLQAAGGATVNLTDTIVARGSANSAGTENCYVNGATLHSLGFNLEDRNQCSLGATGDRADTPPLLGPRADNGGFGIFTEALLPGSAAIDHGNPTSCDDAHGSPVTTDQRGVHRPLDGNADGVARCDIGAYEAPVPKPKCTLKARGSRVFASVVSATAKKHRKGVLSLTARCDQAAGLKLTGRIRATTKRANGKKKVKAFRIAAKHASVKAGSPLTLTVKLPKGALAALKGGSKESASFTLTATNAFGVGSATAKIARLKLG